MYRRCLSWRWYFSSSGKVENFRTQVNYPSNCKITPIRSKYEPISLFKCIRREKPFLVLLLLLLDSAALVDGHSPFRSLFLAHSENGASKELWVTFQALGASLSCSPQCRLRSSSAPLAATWS